MAYNYLPLLNKKRTAAGQYPLNGDFTIPGLGTLAFSYAGSDLNKVWTHLWALDVWPESGPLHNPRVFIETTDPHFTEDVAAKVLDNYTAEGRDLFIQQTKRDNRLTNYPYMG